MLSWYLVTNLYTSINNGLPTFQIATRTGILCVCVCVCVCVARTCHPRPKDMLSTPMSCSGRRVGKWVQEVGALVNSDQLLRSWYTGIPSFRSTSTCTS